MRKKPKSISIKDKIASGALLDFAREFCPWVGITPPTAYKHVKSGKLKITKVGRKSTVAAADAIAFCDALREASRSGPA